MKGVGTHFSYSCLENAMDKGAWWATGVIKELDMNEQLTDTHTHCKYR